MEAAASPAVAAAKEAPTASKVASVTAATATEAASTAREAVEAMTAMRTSKKGGIQFSGAYVENNNLIGQRFDFQSEPYKRATVAV
ncbi:hypothetical protein ZWY2020_043873 [Hordeum vulgare]|nr:hypothetical protein ZWY2020_043873 [Hordeum vulgare]